MPAPGINLVDANVWLALIAKDHFHHRDAMRWFDDQLNSSCVFCRVTQMAFLRHLTNPKIMRGENVRSQVEAWRDYEALLEDPRVDYLREPAGTGVHFKRLTQSSHPKRSSWTDGYLAAIAQVAGYGIVTFDRDFLKMPSVLTMLPPTGCDEKRGKRDHG